MVRVLLCREGARNVAHDFEEQADGECDEEPVAEADDLGEVDDEEDGEPDGCEEGEGEGRGEAVNDDADVPFAAGVGEVGVDVAALFVD